MMRPIQEPIELEEASIGRTETDADDPDIEIDKEFGETLTSKLTKSNDLKDLLNFDGLGYKCQYCSKECGNNAMLKQHLVKHTKEKNFECPECGKKFGTSAILYNHRGVHYPQVCEICNAKFAQKANFKKHKASMHQIYDL